jgi:hypothetical protein
MEPCYLCGISSYTEKKPDGVFVKCAGPCGPYIITDKVLWLDDLNKMSGRKQAIIDKVNRCRQTGYRGCIRIGHYLIERCEV